jgi:hypothetical protein
MSDGFSFLKENFGPLARAELLIAGPFILLYGIVFAFVSGKLAFPNLNYQLQYTLAILLHYSFQYLAISFIITVACAYVLLCNDPEKNTDITMGQIWNKVKSLLADSLAITLQFIIISAILFLLCYAVFKSTNFAAGAVFAPLVFNVLSAKIGFAYYCNILGGEPPFTSLGKSWSLSNGYFWPNLALIFLYMIMLAILSSALMFIGVLARGFYHLSSYRDMLALYGERSVLSMTIKALTTCAILFLYLIAIPPFIFQYYNMRERKEGTGLLSKIENLGIENTEESWGEEKY